MPVTGASSASPRKRGVISSRVVGKVAMAGLPGYGSGSAPAGGSTSKALSVNPTTA